MLWVIGAVAWCAFGFGLHLWYGRRHDDVTLEDVLMFLLFCWCWPVTMILAVAERNSDTVLLKKKSPVKEALE